MEKSSGRVKIEKMSAEVVDSNPYSRLMALQRMGIVQEYERIRQKSVAVVGKLSLCPIWRKIIEFMGCWAVKLCQFYLFSQILMILM